MLVDNDSGVVVVDHWTMQITGHAVGVQPAGLVMSVVSVSDLIF